nr:galanin receptor 2b-like [Lytechinus pictus]
MGAESQNISMDVEWVWAPVTWEWWQIIQLVLAIVGILGNLMVMLVIFRPNRKRCATDTLIGALAVADFLTSIFIIPHPHAIQLPETFGGEFYCRIIHTSILMWISICASIFTLTTISVERLVAVRFPIWFQRLFSPKRTSIGVVIIWIAAFVINIGSLYAHFVRDNQCILSLPVAFHKFLGVCLFVLEYVVPVLIMVTSHGWAIYSLRQRQATALRQVENRVLQTLLIVVITFIICWTPDQFGFLVFNLGVVPFTHLFSPLYRCFVILAFANSCANPFIYAARMPRFRKAMMDLFCIKSISRGEGVPSVFAGDGEGRSDEVEIKTKSSVASLS